MYRTRSDGPLVVVIQSGLPGSLRSRLVVPPLPVSGLPPAMDPRLRPVVSADDEPLAAAVLEPASILVSEIGDRVADAEDGRDGIVRALDIVIGGV